MEKREQHKLDDGELAVDELIDEGKNVYEKMYDVKNRRDLDVDFDPNYIDG